MEPFSGLQQFAMVAVRLALAVVAFAMLMRLIKSVFLLMTHGGSEDRKDAAVGLLKEGLVGMIIVVVSASVAPSLIATLATVADRYLFL